MPAGDMNWTDSRDGSPPLPSGWVDAWQKLQGGQPGFTYDSKSNPMLTFKGQGLRLDRWASEGVAGHKPVNCMRLRRRYLEHSWLLHHEGTHSVMQLC